MKSKKDILLKHVPDIEYELRLSKCNSILEAMEEYKDEFVKENKLKPSPSPECAMHDVGQSFHCYELEHGEQKERCKKQCSMCSIQENY